MEHKKIIDNMLKVIGLIEDDWENYIKDWIELFEYLDQNKDIIEKKWKKEYIDRDTKTRPLMDIEFLKETIKNLKEDELKIYEDSENLLHTEINGTYLEFCIFKDSNGEIDKYTTKIELGETIDWYEEVIWGLAFGVGVR